MQIYLSNYTITSYAFPKTWLGKSGPFGGSSNHYKVRMLTNLVHGAVITRPLRGETSPFAPFGGNVIILNGCSTLEERFSQIDDKIVREQLRKSEKNQE